MAIFFKKSRPPDTDTPSLEPHAAAPVFEVAESLYENQKRALVVWIAKALEQNSGLFTSMQAAEIAVRLVELEENGEDGYAAIKNLALNERELRVVLDHYEKVKPDIGKYLPIGRQSESGDSPEEDPRWNVYRDVIFAFTQGKFVMIRPRDMELFEYGNLLGSAPIRERSDIPKARDLAKQLLLQISVPQTMIMSYLLVISEAITNILKHADEGMMQVFESDANIHVVIEDKGPGFPLEMIPKTTLMEGFSTKRSMGQGFHLMMKMADRILLCTTPGIGSTLILEFNRKEARMSHESTNAG